MWALFKEATRMVNFIHDETINEIKIASADQMTAEIARIEELMVSAMQKIVPQVKISVEASLMDRWYKEAKPLRDKNGNIQLWLPKEN